MTSSLTLHIEKSTIIPITITILIGTCLTIIAIFSGSVNQEAVIFPETIGGATFGLLNALFYLGFGIIGGLLIFIIIKFGKQKLLKIIFFCSFVLITSMIIFLYGSLLSIIFNFVSYEIPISIISIFLGILITYQLFSETISNTRKNISLLLLGGSLGSFLGIFLPSWTTFLMLTLFSIWDYYAVKKGPIKKIVELDEQNKQNFTSQLSFSSEEWEIGLGDLVFYTMLTSHILYNCNVQDTYFSFVMNYGIVISLIPYFAALVGVLVGAKITFRLLIKHKLLPGLPVSIGLGILFFLITIFSIILFYEPVKLL